MLCMWGVIDYLRNGILVNSSPMYFFLIFPCCPCTWGVSLAFRIVCLLVPHSLVGTAMRFNTAVFASDLVPCIQSALFIWVRLSPGTDRLPSVSSVPLSSWKHKCSSRTGETGSPVLSILSFSQPSGYIWKQEGFVSLALGQISPNLEMLRDGVRVKHRRPCPQRVRSDAPQL